MVWLAQALLVANWATNKRVPILTNLLKTRSYGYIAFSRLKLTTNLGMGHTFGLCDRSMNLI